VIVVLHSKPFALTDVSKLISHEVHVLLELSLVFNVSHLAADGLEKSERLIVPFVAIALDVNPIGLLVGCFVEHEWLHAGR
jgi:hypothetical protein